MWLKNILWFSQFPKVTRQKISLLKKLYKFQSLRIILDFPREKSENYPKSPNVRIFLSIKTLCSKWKSLKKNSCWNDLGFLVLRKEIRNMLLCVSKIIFVVRVSQVYEVLISKSHESLKLS